MKDNGSTFRVDKMEMWQLFAETRNLFAFMSIFEARPCPVLAWQLYVLSNHIAKETSVEVIA